MLQYFMGMLKTKQNTGPAVHSEVEVEMLKFFLKRDDALQDALRWPHYTYGPYFLINH